MSTTTVEPIAYVQLAADAVPSLYIEDFDDWTDADLRESEPPHRHNYHLVMWFRAGSGRHRIDARSIDIRPNTLCVIPKGCIHMFEQVVDLAGFVVAWTDDVFQTDRDYPQDLLQCAHESLAIPIAERDELAALTQLIRAEYGRTHVYGQSASLRHLLGALLVRIERLRHLAADSANHPTRSHDLAVYQAFDRLLETHYPTHHDVKFYAEQLGFSTSRLSRVIGEVTGKTTKHLIGERIMLEAKRYLHFTDFSIKQISLMLGYDDPFHFSKLFKQATTVSPQQYREWLHKNP